MQLAPSRRALSSSVGNAFRTLGAAGAFAILGLSGLSAASAQAAILHVFPLGSDAWSGTLAAPNAGRSDGPKATLAGARDAVRALKAQGNLNDTVRVRIADGEYYLTESVLFTPADAGTAAFPVVYEADAGAHPVFLGGKEIKGFRAGADGLWKTSVPEAATLGGVPGKWRFEQLFVSGRRAVRAREPNAPSDSLFDVRLSHDAMAANIARSHFAIVDVQQTLLSGGKASQAVTVGADAAKALGALDAAALKDVILMVYHNWDDTRRFIKGYAAGSAPGTGIITTEGDSMKPWNPWKKDCLFHLENFRQALDQPGEWFLDRDGTLLYKPRPGEDPAQARVFAPSLEKWIVFQGDPAAGRFVEHLRFRGLSFRYSQWLTPPEGFEPAQAAAPIEAALMADGARDLVFSGCEFAHTGGYAVWFRMGCQNIRLEHSLIHDFGAGGLRIGETRIAPAGDQRTGNIIVDNNIIRSGGHIFPCAVGVWVGQSGDNNVTHNDIGDLPYSAISAGWTWGYGLNLGKRNHFDGNHLHHLGKGLMSDMAAYYGLGLSEGTTVNGNLVHDVYSQTYGGWGLYTDEGSTGVTMRDNLVYNCKTGAFHQHYGADNLIRNNIFAFGVQWQLQMTRVEPHLSFTLANNIVYWDQGTLYSGPFDQGQTHLEKNLFWDADGKAIAFPGGKTLPAWQTAGHDSGSKIADPFFVDAGKYDFRLQSGSPAISMGFAPFDYFQAGVYGDAAWIARAKGGESAPEGLWTRQTPSGGSSRAALYLAALAWAPDGKSIRMRITLSHPADGIDAEAFTSQGKRVSHRRYGPLPAGIADLALPCGAQDRAPDARFLRLRSGSQSITARLPAAAP